MSSITKKRIGAVILILAIYLFIGIPFFMDGDVRAIVMWTFMYFLILCMIIGAYLAFDN
jgi:hypothetical protein